MQELIADVIVIGGGGAGTYAALRLQQLGLSPLLVSKGPVGKSGASIMAGSLIVGGNSLGGTRANVDASLEFFAKYYQHFLVDQDYLFKAGEWIEKVFYPELDEMGLYFRRDDQGSIILSRSPVRWSIAPQQGQTGILLMEMRRKQLRRAGIPFLDDAQVTALMRADDGRIAGAVAMRYGTGEIVALKAKAVVMATGHADRLTRRTTATREQSADGIALALRAGAELTNLEMQFWHASDFKDPKCWQRMHIYPNPLVGTDQSSRMYNADGEVFFEQSRDAPAALAPYSLQVKRLIQQVQQGKATLEGGYYSSYAHIDPQITRAYQYHAKAFDKLGYDVATDRIENCTTMHYRQGGIESDPFTMETSVPGLYAAGGVGSHVTGSLAVATYDGNVVAERIAARGLGSQRVPSFDDAAFEIERRRLEALRRPLPAGGDTPMAIKQRLWDVMWRDMGPIKSGAGMQAALDDIRSLRERLPAMGLRTTTRNFNYGWVDAIDVQNLIDVCEVTILSALQRCESRGSFYRTDYPFTDNDHWLKKNIIRCDGEGGFVFRHEDYTPKYLQPDFGRRDYFEAAW